MGLILLLFLSSLAIAGCAAYFSVIGLAAMFAAAYWPVVIMGSALELGKLVAASFVYRTWATTGFLMKTYLIGAVAVLMLVTSLGIFGFLSKGFGDSTQMLQQVTVLTEAKQLEVNQVNDRLTQINRIVEDVPASFVSKRIDLQREYGKELKTLEQRRETLRAEMATLQQQKLEADAHVGPILYVADMFGVSTQDAVKFFILALILVFDPLAVVLTLATNHAIEQYQMRRAASLAEKRQHELAIEHEKHVAAVSPAPTEGAGRAPEEAPAPAPVTAPPAPIAVQEAAPVPPVPVPAEVPKVVANNAVRRAPTVAEMNAALRQTPALHAATATASVTAPTLSPPAEPTAMLGGAPVPVSVFKIMGAPDQELLDGLAKGIPATTLATTLNLSITDLHKRGLALAERLRGRGYPVDSEKLFT